MKIFKMEEMPQRSHNRTWLGFWFLLIGFVLLVQHLDLGLPGWVFSWQTFLIVFGLFLGIRSNFRGPAWLILMFIGGVFLLNFTASWPVHEMLWPIVLIGIGIVFIISPRHHHHLGQRRPVNQVGNPVDYTGASAAPEDFLNYTAAFGGVKKTVMSKNFKGGEITSFMGGAEINLSQADITGVAELEVTSVFGGTKLIIPTNWDVKSEIVAVFGGVEDRRSLQSSPDPNKILLLKGTSVFGGIELRNF